MARPGNKLAAAAAFCALVAPLAPPDPAAANNFIVQQARDQKYFIINDNDFEARDPVCRFLNEGDPVVFLTGDPEGRCLTAVIKNLSNGQSCEMWCRDKPYQR